MKKALLLFFTAVIFLSSNGYAQKYDLSKTPVLYTIGYAHLDTEWRWDYQTTINEYIWNTMADNFKLFEKYPDYIFNFSGAIRYMMMKEYYPDEFEKVKKYVKEGKWFPAGSSMEENDVLAPSHESMIRQILLGSDYFRKELGVSSNEFILPDCFGYLYSLPSILSHCGIKGFSTQKLTWGSAVGIPFSVGKWIGVDGESIVAALDPGDYGHRYNHDLNKTEWLNRTVNALNKYGVGAEYTYYGTGDMGGSPTDETVMWIERSIKNSDKVKILFSTTAQMFDDITPQLKEKLPVYKGEFLLTNHSAGSITSAAFMKKMNRKNELLAYKAEASSAIGKWLGATGYNTEKINKAWRLVMGSQFHDILPGTSIPRAYDFAQNDEIVAANQFSAVFADASGSIIKGMDTKVKGVPVVVFNPLSFEREDCVEASVVFSEVPKYVKVYNKENDEVPSQIVSVEGNKVKVVFLASMPSVSYSAFDIRPSEKPSSLSTGLKATESSLENSKYIVKLNSSGDISSIYDKTAKKELLASPVRLAFQYEKPQEYPAWNMDWADRKNPPTGYVEGPAKIKIVENGPARIVLEVERETRNSKFIEQIRLSAGDACERVEFNTKIDWSTKETSLKATFPLTVSNKMATYNLGVGTIERSTNDSLKFEVPAHQWFDLTDNSGSYGVSVLDDCKYGSDKPADNTVRLTLLYTPAVRGGYNDQAVQDFGTHEMLYALYGHKGDWKKGNSNNQALRINQPLIAFQTGAHEGVLGKEISFLSINNPDIILSALKKAENSDEIIVRFVETKNKEAKKVQVSFASEVVSAKEVNGQEQELGTASVKGGKLIFDAAPYHLKTFAVTLKPAAGQLTMAKSVPVEMPYNVDVFSNDRHKADGNFGEGGKSYPAELLPETFISENIQFKLGPKEDGMKNAVACAGQTIKLPSGNYNKLYIIAASSDKLNKEVFKIGGKEIEIPVEYWSGFLGQWDRRNWENVSAAEMNFGPNIVFTGLTPGYVKKENAAYFTTHRHSRNGENEAYIYAYMFKYKIDIPQGASEIILPKNDKVKILAISAAENENDNAVPAQSLFDEVARDKDSFKRFQTSAKPQIVPEKGYINASQPLYAAISSADEKAEIRYTTDGTAPTKNSAKYSCPVKIDNTCVINAVSFTEGKLPSNVIAGYFSKSIPVKDIIFNLQPTQRRTGWEKALIDLVKGTTESGDRKWQNYERADMDVTLDLGEMKNVNEVVLNCLLKPEARVFLPVSVEILVSKDNKEFTAAANENIPPVEKSTPASITPLIFKIMKETRYIRIKAKNAGAVPVWHKEKNAGAIMSIDEITVK